MVRREAHAPGVARHVRHAQGLACADQHTEQAMAAVAQTLAEHVTDDPISPRELEVLGLGELGDISRDLAFVNQVVFFVESSQVVLQR